MNTSRQEPESDIVLASCFPRACESQCARRRRKRNTSYTRKYVVATATSEGTAQRRRDRPSAACEPPPSVPDPLRPLPLLLALSTHWRSAPSCPGPARSAERKAVQAGLELALPVGLHLGLAARLVPARRGRRPGPLRRRRVPSACTLLPRRSRGDLERLGGKDARGVDGRPARAMLVGVLRVRRVEEGVDGAREQVLPPRLRRRRRLVRPFLAL
ncbi:hypothetical protein DMC30DRAFT_402722 [Rhodotorula diobovata]|uniref:Uncharacterized protein n=1 Tax=Rhodotorula diobovata TaxID=5288 RepID=A0A5C5FP47_9BASI|nr:hypothetical protein DMC30DRAFT_402722 [Rhodotorula diobovata]